jgi:hypothetical protein
VIDGDTTLTLSGIRAALRADVHASLLLPMTGESSAIGSAYRIVRSRCSLPSWVLHSDPRGRRSFVTGNPSSVPPLGHRAWRTRLCR